MKRRWFQFSLRTAIVLMLIAAVGIEIYVRWPYYCAAEILDHAYGDKGATAWGEFRTALIGDEDFRNWAVFARHSDLKCTIGYLEHDQVLLSVTNGEWWQLCRDPKTGTLKPEHLFAYE